MLPDGAFKRTGEIRTPAIPSLRKSRGGSGRASELRIVQRPTQGAVTDPSEFLDDFFLRSRYALVGGTTVPGQRCQVHFPSLSRQPPLDRVTGRPGQTASSAPALSLHADDGSGAQGQSTLAACIAQFGSSAPFASVPTWPRRHDASSRVGPTAAAPPRRCAASDATTTDFSSIPPHPMQSGTSSCVPVLRQCRGWTEE